MSSTQGLFITVDRDTGAGPDDHCMVVSEVGEQRQAALALLTIRESLCHTPIDSHSASLDYMIPKPTNFSRPSRPSTPYLQIPTPHVAQPVRSPRTPSPRPHPLRSHPTHPFPAAPAASAASYNRYFSCYSDFSNSSASTESSISANLDLDTTVTAPDPGSGVNDTSLPTDMLDILTELRALHLRLESMYKSILQFGPPEVHTYLDQSSAESQRALWRSRSEDGRADTQHRRGRQGREQGWI